jgi:hypothetical protein
MTHLRQRMIEDMGIRNLADNTQSAYLQQIIAYAEHFHRSPEELGPEAVENSPSRFIAASSPGRSWRYELTFAFADTISKLIFDYKLQGMKNSLKSRL